MSGRTAERVAGFYDQAGGWLGERSLYFNQGYWRDRPATYDDACDAMADLLGRAARLGPGDRVLDAGFGYADQDIYWMAHFRPARITGVNVSSEQIRVARERVAAAGFASAVDLREASAVDLPLADASVDRVVALESAHHFDTRERFFEEAFRVLVPGGRLAFVDIVPMAPRIPAGLLRDVASLPTNRTLIPPANMHGRTEVARRLQGAGYAEVSVVSIREHVYAPGAAYLARRGARWASPAASWRSLTSPHGLDRLSFEIMTRMYLAGLRAPALAPLLVEAADRGPLDYILGSAVKPGGPAA